jgi:hypothetical protein
LGWLSPLETERGRRAKTQNFLYSFLLCIEIVEYPSPLSLSLIGTFGAAIGKALVVQPGNDLLGSKAI